MQSLCNKKYIMPQTADHAADYSALIHRSRTVLAKKKPQSDRQRHMLAQECAKILAEEGITDFAKAKRKAAARLNMGQRVLLPSNQEVQQALQDYQRLFMADTQPQQLVLLRQTAVQAMQFLSDFQPLLVGPVLQGTATRYSAIHLHITAANTEEVMIYLMNHDIPFESSQRRLRLSEDQVIDLPVLTFTADTFIIDLTVFPQDRKLPTPRSPIDGRSMPRANLAKVQQLLNGTA